MFKGLESRNDLILSFILLSNITEDDGHAGEFAFIAVHRESSMGNMVTVALSGNQDRILILRVLAFIMNRFGCGRREPFAGPMIDQIQNLFELFAHRFGALETGQAAGQRVHEHDIPLNIGHDEAVIDGFENDPMLLG